MKKFVFQLESLLKVKKTQRETLQIEYSETKTAYGNALTKKELIEKTIDNEREQYENRAKNGMTVSEIRASSDYFDELRKHQKSAATDAERAKQVAERKHQELLVVFREIKTLEKLREKQYENYLAEEGKRDSRSVEDMLSFNISDKSVNVCNIVRGTL